jgi:histone H3
MARVLAEPPGDTARRIASGGIVASEGPEKPARSSKMKQIREIKKDQSTAELILPKALLERLVREIAEQMRGDVRFQTPVGQALKEAVEASLVKAMENGLISTARDHGLTSLTRCDCEMAESLNSFTKFTSHHKSPMRSETGSRRPVRCR